MSDLVIRPATADDTAAIEVVTQAAFARLRDIYRPSQSVHAKIAAVPSPGCIVAAVDHEVVGLVKFYPDGARLQLFGLAVSPSSQRGGVGGQLIEHVVNMARANGSWAVGLYTIQETGNVAYFEKQGFRVVGESIADWCESDRFEVLHEIEMERTI